MEILIGVLISGITEIAKMLRTRMGEAATRSFIYITVFLGVLVYTTLTYTGVITVEMVKAATVVLSSAIATYEIIIKPIKEKLELK